MSTRSLSRKARRSARRFAAAAPLALLLAAGAGANARAAVVVVDVAGVTPGGGPVYVSLCSGGFAPAQCGLAATAAAAGPAVRIEFPGVAPGAYGVAAFQDLNGNGSLDRSTHGLPLEPYGFSNGAGRTGAPRFEQAAVRIQGDGVIPIRLQRLPGRP